MVLETNAPPGTVVGPLPPVAQIQNATRAAAPLPPPVLANGNVQAIALVTSVDVHFLMGQPWRAVELACEYLLETLAFTAGCYDSRQSLHVRRTS
jgi:hypothetical protein